MVIFFIHSTEIMAQSAMVVGKGQKKDGNVSVGVPPPPSSYISTNASTPSATRVVANVENNPFVATCKITSSRK